MDEESAVAKKENTLGELVAGCKGGEKMLLAEEKIAGPAFVKTSSRLSSFDSHLRVGSHLVFGATAEGIRRWLRG